MISLLAGTCILWRAAHTGRLKGETFLIAINTTINLHYLSYSFLSVVCLSDTCWQLVHKSINALCASVSLQRWFSFRYFICWAEMVGAGFWREANELHMLDFVPVETAPGAKRTLKDTPLENIMIPSLGPGGQNNELLTHSALSVSWERILNVDQLCFHRDSRLCQKRTNSLIPTLWLETVWAHVTE